MLGSLACVHNMNGWRDQENAYYSFRIWKIKYLLFRSRVLNRYSSFGRAGFLFHSLQHNGQQPAASLPTWVSLFLSESSQSKTTPSHCSLLMLCTFRQQKITHRSINRWMGMRPWGPMGDDSIGYCRFVSRRHVRKSPKSKVLRNTIIQSEPKFA
jgi:hypothetical protein